jgi:hypothetical protein
MALRADSLIPVCERASSPFSSAAAATSFTGEHFPVRAATSFTSRRADAAKTAFRTAYI